MQHAAVLDVAALAHRDALGIAPDNDAKPNTGVRAQMHIAHDLGAVGDIGRVGHCGGNLIKFVDGHGNSWGWVADA